MALLLLVAGVGAWWSQRPAADAHAILPTLQAPPTAMDRNLAWKDAYEQMSDDEIRAETERVRSAPPSRENSERLEYLLVVMRGIESQPAERPAQRSVADLPERSEDDRLGDEFRNSGSELGRVRDEQQVQELVRRAKEEQAQREREGERSLRSQ